MSSRKVYLKANEIFPLLDRTVERQRVLATGLEAISYAHPHKKFYYRIDRSDYESLTSGTMKGLAYRFDVMDYGLRVGKIGTYKPDGNERDKVQVQFEYDYNVHQKEPRNVKRSSNHSKIFEFATLFRALNVSVANTLVMSEMINGVADSLDQHLSVRNANKEVTRMLDSLYYGDRLLNARILYDICVGQVTPDAIAFKDKIVNAYSGVSKVMAEAAKTMSKIAIINPTPHGEYFVARFELKDYKKRGDVEGYQWLPTIYPSKDSLPEDLVGRVSVLEIADTSDVNHDEHYVDGIGLLWKNTNRMIVFGEDLHGINTGTESQSASS